ncbi:HD/PDEase domain protein [Listeria phage LIS04]|nr:HD/PDEase domain protein [Listeria phage LIS04]
MDNVNIKESLSMEPNSVVVLDVLVGNFQSLSSKNNRAYLKFTMSDSSGSTPATAFDDLTISLLSGLGEGQVVRVSAKVNLFNNTTNLVVTQAWKHESANIYDFVPSYSKQYRDMAVSKLINLVDSIEDERYLKLTRLTLGLDGDRSDFNKFINSIGSVAHHHSKIGGLVIHTYGVARIADTLTRMYRLNSVARSRLLFLAIVHDVQKRDEYESFPVSKRTDLLLTHVPRGASFIEAINMYYGNILDTEELVLCQKALLLHHGEWSNYKVNELYREEYPLEAKLLHSFDQIEASSYEMHDNVEDYLKALLEL